MVEETIALGGFLESVMVCCRNGGVHIEGYDLQSASILVFYCLTSLEPTCFSYQRNP